MGRRYKRPRSSALALHALALLLVIGTPVPLTLAQTAPPVGQASDLDAAIAKSNAFIALMNRTLRASESWARYTSWVNVKTGPTGRERYIDYGLYSLYDVRDLLQTARAATRQPPLVPELDAAVLRYADAYEALAPLITAANGYYERKDYKVDKAAEGRQLHTKLVPAAKVFLDERARVEILMKAFKGDLDRRTLAALEAEEGRGPRWQIKNVMTEAEHMMDLLPSSSSPIVDLGVFDAGLAAYARAVREIDQFTAAYPGKLSVFESQPRSLLGKLREFRDKLGRAKGDARRGAGQDMIWIVNEYNMMVSTSQSAIRFGR